MSRFLIRKDIQNEICFVLDEDTLRAEIKRLFGVNKRKEFLLKSEIETLEIEVFSEMVTSPDLLFLLTPEYLISAVDSAAFMQLMDAKYEGEGYARNLKFELNRIIAGVDTDFAESLISFFRLEKPKIPFKNMPSLYDLKIRKELYERGLRSLSA